MSPTSIRVVPELRAAHVERHRAGAPAELLYLDTNYDLAGTGLAEGIRRTTMIGALGRFVSTAATTLEVPEPLWMRFWPKHVLLAVGFKVTGAIRGRRRRVVTYAMENNDLGTLVGGRRAVPSWVVNVVGLLVGAVARLTLDRIRFATPAARAAYDRLPFICNVEHSVGLELPSPSPAPRPAEPGSCVFLGVLEARKGVEVLATAWETVEAHRPDASLSIIGPGPQHERLRRWASQRPASRRVLGRLPHHVANEELSRASVLVAPSVPDGRWREQVGLPVKEALAAGLTVVTTDQTGLAPWLAQHGHRVVQPGDPALLADALVAALDAPLPREVVRGDLPEQDGRLVADAWLHA
ncbi:glycosyltransferase family 4 protein [Curtobacterium sp. NPDC089689]|uniref:glycosyltransferase family 4 protein n=1 Tax=Curtobacterium sp. NPDC089689 TaxID=3363968 RepID=UPI00381DBA66